MSNLRTIGRLWLVGVFAALLGGAQRPAKAQSATQTVSGTITEKESGRPLANAQIAIVGTSLGAMSNTTGRYVISGVPVGAQTIRVILIGHTAQSRPITVAAGQSVVADFAMEATATRLSEVVAVGYGSQTSRNVTGSVASVGLDRLRSQPVAGIDKALAGQVPGVQVLQSNGTPGGGPQIQIRGVGAIGAGSSPLFVVDGFPLPSSGAELRNPLNEISPNDIESISILKDASAAAIYGSRAANGVVVITTKTGRNQAPQMRIDITSGVQSVASRFLPQVMNATEFATFMKERYEDDVRYNLGREPTINDVPVEYRTPQQYGAGTDWLRATIRNAPTTNVNFSVSGGNQSISGYLSGGYLSEVGTVLGTDYTRYTLRANINANPRSNLRVGLNLAPTFSVRNLPVTGGAGRNENGAPAQAALVSPLLSPRLPDGSWRATVQTPGMLAMPNPLMYLEQFKNDFRNLRSISSAFAEWKPVSTLTIKTQASADYGAQQQTNYRPSSLGVQFSPPPRVPVGNYIENNYVNWLTEQTATFDDTFGQHHVQVTGGYSVQANRSLSGTFNGTNYANDDIPTLNAAGVLTGGTDRQKWGLVSYLSRLNYDYADGKYLLSGALRRDGSSRFAPASRWGIFPSASAGWRISQEPWLRNIGWLTDLKLRTSVGLTGNNDIGNYSYVGQVGISDYILANTLASGRTLNTLGNPDLGWEKTQEANVGFDLSLFNDRIALTVDAYNGVTKDLLLNVEIPQSSGFGTVTRNTGRVRNRGLEVALRTVNMRRGRFEWTTDFNVAMNRNVVLALGANNAPIRSGTSGEQSPTHITRVGSPVGMFYGYVFQGLYRDAADVAASAKFPGAIPGNVKMKDINGDGNITAVTDFDVIGNPYPDATFGFNNTLRYGRLDLSVIATAQLGGDRLQGFFQDLHNIDGVFNVGRDVANRWRSPTQTGSGFHPTTAGVSRGRVLYRDVSSLWVQDASNISIRNITLRYRFPEKLARVRDANVFIGLQNAFVFSKYPMNPDVTNYNRQVGALTPGYDAVAYPIARTFTFGTSIGY